MEKSKCPCCDRMVYKIVLGGETAYVEEDKLASWQTHTCYKSKEKKDEI